MTAVMAVTVPVLAGGWKNGEPERTVADNGQVPEYRIVDKPQVNLSVFEKDKDGYYVIFNGKDLTGWRTYGYDVPTSKWSVEDGCIRLTESGELVGGDLLFAYKFRNFIFEFEWKLPSEGNSGVFYLTREVTVENNGTPVYAPTCYSAPEYQMYDDSVDCLPVHKSAALYDMIPPDPLNCRPGEWNHGRITVRDGVVTHNQNGVDVLEYNLWTPQWTEMVQHSKFSQKECPLAFELLNDCGGKEHEGYIVLQDHRNDAWFRNIRIKLLP